MVFTSKNSAGQNVSGSVSENVSEYEQIENLVSVFRFDRPSLQTHFLMGCYHYNESDAQMRRVFGYLAKHVEKRWKPATLTLSTNSITRAWAVRETRLRLLVGFSPGALPHALPDSLFFTMCLNTSKSRNSY